jgi:catechol 2,3-dioxygenase-like lactoylglutathione lyase family enzyme
LSHSPVSSAGAPISAVNHIALMTRDLDRLTDFYERVFGAEVLARAESEPRKCFLRLTATTNLHVFEHPGVATPPDDGFDRGSINHFALEASDPGAFIAIRDLLTAEGRANESVYDAPGLYTLFATDPDGLFIEVLVAKQPGWTPPFATEPFVPLG